MKRLLLASAALTIMSSGAALADTPGGWYLGAGVGANWVNDESVDTVFGATVDAEFDTGWAITGDVGYRWWDAPIRLAFELGYRSNDVESIGFSGGPPVPGADGEVTQFSVMANLLLDFPLGEDAILTLGGGIGAAKADYEAGTAGTTFVESDDDFELAYQGIAGVAFAISDQLELFGEYRYFANQKHDIVTFPGGVPLDTEADFDNHTATIGLRFFLEPPPAPVTETAPAPAPAPMTNFTVLFDYNKANLTADGQAAVAEAADALKGGAASVTIEAQGDGDPSRDQDLAERRGAAVKAALVNMGIAPDKITVETHEGGDATVTASQ